MHNELQTNFFILSDLQLFLIYSMCLFNKESDLLDNLARN